jgi:hypothetical protein
MKIAHLLQKLALRAVIAGALMVCVVGVRGCGPTKPGRQHPPINNGTDASYRAPGTMEDGQWQMADGKAAASAGRRA